MRSSNVLAVVQRCFKMWSTGISVLAPTVNNSARFEDLCRAHAEARKASFMTEASIQLLTAAQDFVADKQIALPVSRHVRQKSLGLPSGL